MRKKRKARMGAKKVTSKSKRNPPNAAGKRAPKPVVKTIVDSIVRAFRRAQKATTKRLDETVWAHPETEARILSSLNMIINEAIADSPKRDHLARARAALATSSQYIRGTIAVPELVSCETVEAVVERAARLDSKTDTSEDLVGPAFTRMEVADVLLAGAGVLFITAIPGSVSTLNDIDKPKPVSLEVIQLFRTKLVELAELIRVEHLNPESIDLGMGLEEELRSLGVVWQFIEGRVNTVRDSATPLGNATSMELCVPSRSAASAERMLMPQLAHKASPWTLRHNVNEDHGNAVADSITDMCHWAKSMGFDPEQLLESAQLNYEEERNDVPSLHYCLWPPQKTA